MWWSGLTTADARRGFEVSKAQREEVEGRSYWTVRSAAPRKGGGRLVHLLPIYDEYLVAYRDRDAVPHGPTALASKSAGSVTFRHALVVAGQVAGTWRTTRQAGAVSMHAVPLRPFSRAVRRALTEAVLRYEQFLSVGVELTFE